MAVKYLTAATTAKEQERVPSAEASCNRLPTNSSFRLVSIQACFNSNQFKNNFNFPSNNKFKIHYVDSISITLRGREGALLPPETQAPKPGPSANVCKSITRNSAGDQKRRVIAVWISANALVAAIVVDTAERGPSKIGRGEGCCIARILHAQFCNGFQK